jgi:hypothetical protein
MTTEAVRTKSPTLELGRSFSSFVRAVGLVPEGSTFSGGKRGVGRLAQRQTLFLKAIVSWSYAERNRDRGKNIVVADDYDLAWDPARSDDMTLWTSKVTLSAKFFEEMTCSPVPIDLRALKALKRSPMRLDIYSWLTWRMFRGQASCERSSFALGSSNHVAQRSEWLSFSAPFLDMATG